MNIPYGLSYKEFFTTYTFYSDDLEECVSKLSADKLEELKNKILGEKSIGENVKSDNTDKLQIREVEDFIKLSVYRRKFKTDAKRILDYLEIE